MRKKLMIIGAILMFNIANCEVLNMINSSNDGAKNEVSVVVRGYGAKGNEDNAVVIRVKDRADGFFAEYVINKGETINSLGGQAKEQIKGAMLKINKTIMDEDDSDIFINKLGYRIDTFLGNEK